LYDRILYDVFCWPRGKTYLV